MLAEEYLDNLDCTWPDDLEAYANRLKAARDISGEDAGVRDSLIAYAMRKATAMRQRASGRVNAALIMERQCDVIYNRLPEYARW